jgi:hypothetical protein
MMQHWADHAALTATGREPKAPEQNMKTMTRGASAVTMNEGAM